MREKYGNHSTHLESLRWRLSSGKFPVEEDQNTPLSEAFSVVAR